MSKTKRLIKYIIWWIITVLFLFAIIYTSIFFYVFNWFPYWIILIVAIYILNIVAGLMLFCSSRQSYAKLSWFILVVLFPIVGAVFFLIFGARFNGRNTNEEYHKIHEKIFNYKKNEVSYAKNIDSESRLIMDQISKSVRHPILKSKIDVLDSDKNYFKEMFDSMKSAKKFIHVHYYIFKPGEIFEEFSSILIKKAKEKVKIRMIIDDIGHWALPWYKIKDLEDVGIEVTIWAKVHFPFISGDNGYRTHRKLLIVDGETVFLGGINISDEYAHFSKKYGYWHDLQLKIQGEAVMSYSLLFISDWYFMGDKKIDIETHAPLNKIKSSSYSLMVESGPDNVVSQSLDALIKLIVTAKNSIYLVSPYLVPDDNLVTALRIAASSGVDIKIIIPGLADKESAMSISMYYARRLEKMGVKIFRSKNSFMHSKFGVIDGRIAYAGTLNLDIRSFYQQFEVISIMHGDPVLKLNKLFENYLKYSAPLTFKKSKANILKRSIYDFLVKIFMPLA